MDKDQCRKVVFPAPGTRLLVDPPPAKSLQTHSSLGTRLQHVTLSTFKPLLRPTLLDKLWSNHASPDHYTNTGLLGVY